MLLDLMLPWFPIILSAAVGARLAGPAKATWLGCTCALFWIIVAQTATGVPFWHDLTMLASMLAGSAAIVGMAHWAATADLQNADVAPPAHENDADHDVDVVEHAVARFDDWLERFRFTADPWPAFDEFIRDLLRSTCGATHTRPYRVLSEGEAITPLHSIERSEMDELPSARKGILGHVVTTGRAYYHTDKFQGELVRTLADASDGRLDWCFAVRQGTRTIGVVSVGQVADARPSRGRMRALERLVSQFWITLGEVCRSRIATSTDPASQLMTREAFFEEAQRITIESYEHGEPVAVAVIAVEGLRSLLDEGRWELADDVVREVSSTLRDRVRPDDLLGHFDDSRLLLLLRRVDSELATLIANQVVDRLTRTAAVSNVCDNLVSVRCGVAGSGTGTPTVRSITAAAVRLCQQARKNKQRVASDVAERPTAVGAQE